MAETVDNSVVFLRKFFLLDLLTVEHPVVGRNDLFQKQFGDGTTIKESYVANF